MLVNYHQLVPGSIQHISHPALPDLSRVDQGDQTVTWCVLEGNRLTALCSLWLRDMPCYQGYKSAALGHFFAQSPDAGQQVLEHACGWLADQAIDYVIGPLDGSTWRNYRLVGEQGNRPPFFLEYNTPCDWNQIFIASGFETIATYHSSQTYDLDYHDRSAEKFAVKAASMGLTLRPFDVSRFEEELNALYELSTQSFANNFLYTPISRPQFHALYQPLLPYLIPNLFLLAEHEDRLIGFIFAMPDYLQLTRSEVLDTLIIKTMARSPERRYAGLGSYLARYLHQQAAQMGYRRVIHALMHDDNASSTTSNKSAELIRRYALYGRNV